MTNGTAYDNDPTLRDSSFNKFDIIDMDSDSDDSLFGGPSLHSDSKLALLTNGDITSVQEGDLLNYVNERETRA